jgi:hypothetical protein
MSQKWREYVSQQMTGLGFRKICDFALALGKPRSTVGGWLSGVEPSKKTKRQIREKIKHLQPANSASLEVVSPSASVADGQSDVIVSGVLIEALIPCFNRLALGKKDDRAKLRTVLGDRFDEFLKLVRIMTSESTREVILAEDKSNASSVSLL